VRGLFGIDANNRSSVKPAVLSVVSARVKDRRKYSSKRKGFTDSNPVKVASEKDPLTLALSPEYRGEGIRKHLV
jgi:hypothetical protein